MKIEHEVEWERDLFNDSILPVIGFSVRVAEVRGGNHFCYSVIPSQHPTSGENGTALDRPGAERKAELAIARILTNLYSGRVHTALSY